MPPFPETPLDALAREAAALGVRVDMLERGRRLLALCGAVCAHPDAVGRLALKGGTALNLFVADDPPRLSVDADFNYVGAAAREAMLAERPAVERAVEAAAAGQGLTLRRTATADAGGKWTFRYAGARGRPDALAVDLNYQLRVPLWPVLGRTSRALGDPAVTLPLLDEHELAAGKLAALVGRRASRDLFDAHWLLTGRLASGALDPARLRLACVVYGAMSRTDWRTVTPERVAFDPRVLRRDLLPQLRGAHAEAARRDPAWGPRLVAQTRAALAAVLPLRPAEQAFVAGVWDDGVIQPELLTDDPVLQRRIAAQPALRWRAHQRARQRAWGRTTPPEAG